MRAIDWLSIVTMTIALIGVIAWYVRLRNWPLTIAVVIALISNIAFYIVRSFNWFTPVELNLFSAVRVLLLTLVISVIPFSIGRER